MTVGDVGFKNLFEQKFFKKQLALRGARGGRRSDFYRGPIISKTTSLKAGPGFCHDWHEI
jgi:hypothetical protein